MIAPRTEDELAEAVRDADGPLRVRGGGTRSPEAGSEAESAVLSVSEITGIALHEPGALTLVVAAGTPMAEVEAALARHGQALAFEPMDHRVLLGTSGEPTVGGAVATGAAGPRRVRTGGLRDGLIGARFVDGEGRVLRSGGRVMKNVTGYDLARLQAGARGTLGVLTEVAFKLLPAPSSAATLTLPGLDADHAVRAMIAALGSPFEVSGAAHMPDGATHLRIEGLADSVAYRAGRLTALLAPFGEAVVERDRDVVAALWLGIRDVEALADAPGCIWRIAARPTEAAAAVLALAPESGPERVMLDAGGATIWAAMPEGVDARARVQGPATLVRGVGFPATHPEPPAVAALSEGLRARFDPRGVFARAA